MGKLALVGVAGIALAAAIGVRSSDGSVQTLCVASGLGFALFIAAGILAFGFKYPDQATLEGTEVLAFQHVQQMRAKDIPTPEQFAPQILEGIGPEPRPPEEMRP